MKYGTDSAQTAIVYLSRSGEILKYNRFNLPSGNSRFTSSAIFPAAGGGYMVAQTGNSTPHIFWQKVDAYGSPVWSTETVLTGVQSVSKMIQNADSSFTIVGSNNNHALLLTVLPGSPTSCYDQPANPGFTNPLLSKGLDQLKFSFGLWTRETVAELIRQETGISRSVWQIGRYLREWGFMPPDIVKHVLRSFAGRYPGRRCRRSDKVRSPTCSR